jgi:hypothetical protein
MFADHFPIPRPPKFTYDQITQYPKTRDYMPMVFEWYKFVGMMAAVLAGILPTSPAFRSVPPQHYHVLMGLLNRCARLILSNLALSRDGKFGETTAIVDRCIFESAIMIIWLCSKQDQDEFNRYIGSGLKTELELKAAIMKEVAERGGTELPLETRMLRSIETHISASGLSETEIQNVKPTRDIASVIEMLGHDRLFYVLGQKFGSLHVHGTWPSLVFHYIEICDDRGEFMFQPRGNDCDTNINQFLFSALFVVNAMERYSRYLFDDDMYGVVSRLSESIFNDIMKVIELTEDERQ